MVLSHRIMRTGSLESMAPIAPVVIRSGHTVVHVNNIEAVAQVLAAFREQSERGDEGATPHALPQALGDIIVARAEGSA